MGRDVEQIGRDLVEIAIEQVKTEMREKVAVKAKENTNTRLIEALVGQTASDDTKASFQKKLDAGELEEREIEIQVQETQSAMPSFDIPGMPGAQMGMINLGDLLGKSLGGRTKTLKTSVKEARHLLMNEESEKLLDQEKAVQQP